jgi:hypothetical protein
MMRDRSIAPHLPLPTARLKVNLFTGFDRLSMRKLDTGSKFDQPIVDDMFMWVAVFDHSQVQHTRHVQPLRLRLQ